MNVTNFRNGLGASTIPFEFYDQFQIKTGGYSAEFGRSTGGVVNAVTKRGSNDWQFTPWRVLPTRFAARRRAECGTSIGAHRV